MKINAFFFLSLALILFSCNAGVPGEDEIIAKIKGSYCADDYKLTLTDSTYFNSKFSKGLLTSTPIMESCNGIYSLAFEKDRWMIRFQADPSPRAIMNCKKEYPVWTKKDGYLIGEEVVTLPDLFDDTPLTASGCEDDEDL
jgi:hypothetical protein